MTTLELPKLPLAAAPDLDVGGWAGFLTTVNVRHVAAAVRRILGEQRFSVVTVYEAEGWRPQLTTGASLYPAGRPFELDCVSGYVRGNVGEEVAQLGFSAGGISYGWHSGMKQQSRPGEEVDTRGMVQLALSRVSLETYSMTPEGRGCRTMFRVEPLRQVRMLLAAVRAGGANHLPVDAALRMAGLMDNAEQELGL